MTTPIDDILPILDRLRDNHNRSLPAATPASTLVSALHCPTFDQSYRRIPPTPPLVSFLPSRKRSNPYIINALFLQAIFLGASALGLIRGRKRLAVEQEQAAREERRISLEGDQRICGEEDERLAINFTLSSWASSGAITTSQPVTASSPRQFSASEAVRPIHSLLSQLSSRRIQPDRWTILSLLFFVAPDLAPFREKSLVQSAGPTPKATAYDSARPILLLWAWREWTDMRRTHHVDDKPLLEAFVSLFFDPRYAIRLDPSDIAAIYEELHESLGSLATSLQHLVIKSAIARGNWSLPLRLIAPSEATLSLDAHRTALPPKQRIDVCVYLFRLMSVNEELRGRAGLVQEVAEAFLAAVREIAASGTIAEIDIGVVEKGINLLSTGFGADVACERITTDIALVLLHDIATTPFSSAFITTFLSSLVDSRNPSLALAIFDALPLPFLTLSHYEQLLRSHDARISHRIWQRLRHQSDLVPRVETFYARMLSHAHKHNNNLEGIRDDLRLMQQMNLERTLRMWNKLLQMVVRVGSDRMYARQWKRTVDSRVTCDAATFSILLMRELKSRTGAEQVRAVARRVQEMEQKRFGGRGMRRVVGNEVAQNIAVKSLNRWTENVDAEDLAGLAKRLLAVDIDSSDVQVQVQAQTQEPLEFTGQHFRQVRRPAYKMLIAGLSSRGDVIRRSRAVELMRGEEKQVRAQELSKADRLQVLSVVS